MKKFFFLLISCIMVCLFVACAGNAGEKENWQDTENGQDVSSVTPSFSTEETIAPSLTLAPKPSQEIEVFPSKTPLPSTLPTPLPTIQPPPEAEKVFYLQSKANGLRVRAKPNTSSAVLGVLDRGDCLLFLEKKNGFYQTWYREKVGYVAASYCEIVAMEQASASVERALTFGSKLLGYPYVWGSVRYHDGDGVKNAAFKGTEFDCSALVQYIYYATCKVKLGVTTREQVKNGVAVSRKNLRRGDLLFFTNADREHLTGNQRIGHVAIYLGENYILHTASDYAVIEPISSTRWARYITARRVV